MKNLFLLGFFAAASHCQTLPLGVIVTMPATTTAELGTGTPLQATYTLLLTRELPAGAQVSANVVLATGPLGLWSAAIQPPAFFIQQRCSLPRRSISCVDELSNAGPNFYALTSGSNGIQPLPSGIPISTTIAPPGEGTFTVTTGSFLRGIEQSPDLMTITISGTFDPTAQLSIYLGTWPLAVQTRAIEMASDHITIGINRDQNTFERLSGWYPLTVLQGSTCDSVMFQYRSPFVSRRSIGGLPLGN